MSRLTLITDLNAIESNARMIRDRIDSKVKILSVVKADAYGHGSIQVAKRLESKNLTDYFAVATAGEGLALRKAGIQKDILILGYSDEEEMITAVQNDIHLSIYSEACLSRLSHIASAVKKTAKAHLKIETGMNRIGICPDENLVSLLKSWKNTPEVLLDGIFSHFSSADTSKEYTVKQFTRFMSACSTVHEFGFSPVRHISASSAMFEKAYQLDMVRAGIALYGGSEENTLFLPAQTLKSHPVRIMKLYKGEKIGYGMNYTLSRDTIVMTVPCGYGDGYPRLLSNQSSVLVNGHKAPVIGNICMDMLMADATDAGEIDLSSEVVLLGAQKGNRITPFELAHLSHTIPYEIMLGFSQRVEKSWIE